MFIEYITPQRAADPRFTKIDFTEGDFRPTWLIRTIDWQKIPGDEAKNGYCTLSYCWEQSGKIIPKSDGEYDCINEPNHRLVIGVDKRRLTNFFRKHVVTKVTYDTIVQQVCKDFEIDYLWYDKLCIDQTNKTEKHREIKQMHLIYSNARFTVAMVPEVYIDDPKSFDRLEWTTQNTEAKTLVLYQVLLANWWKRSWTLEELMMTTRILVVGRNTHMWCLARDKQEASILENDLISAQMLGFKDRKMKSANQVVRYAHFRTSTKAHDKIFALTNIFHDTVSIDMDYTSDVKVSMKSFYKQLAERDLSLMCFGSILNEHGRAIYATSMDIHNLPSWTGVAGLHSTCPVTDIALDKNYGYSIDDRMQLHINCRSYTVYPAKYKDHVFGRDERAQQAYTNSTKVITTMEDFHGNETAALDWSQWCMDDGTGCIASHYWKPDQQQAFRSPVLALSLTEDCEECIILAVLFCCVREILTLTEGSGYTVLGYDRHYLLPVLKKSSDTHTYRAVGVVLAKHFLYHEIIESPQDFLNGIFDGMCDEYQDFVIE